MADPCTEMSDVAAYVLGALEDREAESFAAHIESCAHCRAEVARLQVVVDALPVAAPQFVPPTLLKSRIMREVDREAALLNATGAEADHPASRRERGFFAGVLGTLRARPLAGALAAAALIAIVIGGGVALDSGGTSTTSHVAQVTVRGAHAVVRLTGGRTELAVSGMPPAADGRVYQVWFQHGNGAPQPTHTLFSVGHDGSATVEVPDAVRGASRMLVTSEPPGGSLHPTSPAVITASLS